MLDGCGVENRCEMLWHRDDNTFALSTTTIRQTKKRPHETKTNKTNKQRNNFCQKNKNVSKNKQTPNKHTNSQAN